mmetsp:Transcript_12838/g.14749  ORF Transcript_12838/g.14749 Transcript_12838/m.14749 type:complete len:80 (+) Transcript_12838:280-519(+)
MFSLHNHMYANTRSHMALYVSFVLLVTRKTAIDTKKNGCWWRRPILQFRDCFQKKKRNVYVTFSLRGERRPFGFSLQGG